MAVLMRELKRRIKSINNIKQITRAMMLIAVAKLKKEERRLHYTRAYMELIEGILSRVLISYEWEHPLLKGADKLGLLVVGSERGFCGAFNVNVVKSAKELTGYSFIIAVGKRIYKLLLKITQANIIYIPMPDRLDERLFEKISHLLLRSYIKDGVGFDSLYTKFISTFKHIVTKEKILPYPVVPKFGIPYIFEPQMRVCINRLMSMYVKAKVANIIIESFICEQGARMLNMQQATDNAQRLIEELTLSFNKARQEAITKELSDIINTAEAVKL